MEYICVADKLINEKQFLIIEAISLENRGGNENFPDKVRKLSGNIDVWFAISRHTEGESEIGMELELILKKCLSDNKHRLEFVRQELKKCSKGTLTEAQKRGHAVFVQYYYENGNRIRHGITRKTDVVESLIRRRVFEKEEKHLVNEQNILSKYITTLSEFDIDKEIDLLKKDCPHLEEELILKALYLRSDNDWEQASYEQSDYKPEMRKHITSRGLKVRSKSELLIAEKLYAHNIPFHYEQVLHFGTTTLIPDFTIRRNDGKMFIWEHEGMTNVQEYLDWQNQKGRLYASKGIVPWDNLIVTYDNEEGMIDLRIIESEIQNKLIV